MDDYDRISDLPRPILHHILSFLLTKDATKTSILSKLFNSTWLSLPIMDMDYTLFHNNIDFSFLSSAKKTLLTQQFFAYVDLAIQRHRTQETNLQRLRIRVPPSKEEDYRNCVEEFIDFASEKGVVELDINLNGFVGRYSLPLIKQPMHGSFRSVKTLILSNFQLNNTCDQITGFPALEVLSMNDCKASGNFELSSNTIRSVEFLNCNGLNRIEIESTSLKKFVFETVESKVMIENALNALVNAFVGDVAELNGMLALANAINLLGANENQLNVNMLDVRLLGCKFLQDLSISNTTSRWVEETIPKLIHLKNLKLIHCNGLQNINTMNENLKSIELVNCNALNSVKIGPTLLCALETLKVVSCSELQEVDIEHEHLRILELSSCRKLVGLRVDTPQLASFVYKGPLIHFSLINSRAVMHSSLSFESHAAKTDNTYFAKLRNLVGLFDHVRVLTVATASSKELTFPEEVRDELCPSLCDLKHLKVMSESGSHICIETVDSLIWLAPRLETLSFVSRQQHYEKSLKFQYRRLIGDEEDNLLCCHLRVVKCWRHSLKTVEINNFDPVEACNLHNYFQKNAKLPVTICTS